MSSGFLVILSGPSGSGKSTICRKLRRRDSSLRYSVSCCTRKPRPSEKQGTHYHFLSAAEFRRRISARRFLEWARVHENYYGTPAEPIDRSVRAGRVILLDIDVQGAEKIRRKRRDAVTIFLLPPTWGALRRRLVGRRDTQDTMDTRLKNARGELRLAKRYDYWVVNDDLDEAVSEVEAVITAESLRGGRRRLKDARLAGMIRN